MALPREIVYDYTFEAQARLLKHNTKRLDVIIRSAEWKISCHAETCPKILGTILRVAFTDQFPDAQHCTLHWIEPMEPGQDDGDDFDDIPF